MYRKSFPKNKKVFLFVSWPNLSLPVGTLPLFIPFFFFKGQGQVPKTGIPYGKEGIQKKRK